MKTISAFASGGDYEASGDGYGPGVGEGFGKVINIISRASGAPVIAGAIKYAAACAEGRLPQVLRSEFAAARRAGLDDILKASVTAKAAGEPAEEVTAPPKKVVTEEIPGVEILELEDAVRALWAKGIFAVSGMGCTGPVVMVAEDDAEKARAVLGEVGYL